MIPDRETKIPHTCMVACLVVSRAACKEKKNGEKKTGIAQMESKIYQHVFVTTVGKKSTGFEDRDCPICTMAKHESVEKYCLDSEISNLLAV